MCLCCLSSLLLDSNPKYNQIRKDHKQHGSRGKRGEGLTGLEDADDQVHCMDQLQAHALHALEPLLLQDQEPILYLEENHSRT